MVSHFYGNRDIYGITDKPKPVTITLRWEELAFLCCSCRYASVPLPSGYSWVEPPVVRKTFDTAQIWTPFSLIWGWWSWGEKGPLRAILISTFCDHMSYYRSSSKVLYTRFVNHFVNLYVYTRSYWWTFKADNCLTLLIFVVFYKISGPILV